MEKRRQVAVHGSSLSMALIVATLKTDATLEVFCVNLDAPNAWQSLDENEFTVILFDLSDPPRRLDVTTLRNRPGLLLIGLDLSSDEMLVLSSHYCQALSMADLTSLIHQEEFPSSFFRGETPK